MSKVKVTQEQADAIERGIAVYSKTRIMNDHEPDGWMGIFAHLNGLTKDEIARALYIGYEVEPEFKVGDWVINKNTMRAIEVDGPKVDFLNKDYSHGKLFRHATPEEIAEEKERRTDKKLNGFLCRLSSEEKDRLYEKLVSFI